DAQNIPETLYQGAQPWRPVGRPAPSCAHILPQEGRSCPGLRLAWGDNQQSHCPRPSEAEQAKPTHFLSHTATAHPPVPSACPSPAGNAHDSHSPFLTRPALRQQRKLEVGVQDPAADPNGHSTPPTRTPSPPRENSAYSSELKERKRDPWPPGA
ncbi:hypothetical protein H1C71_021393, partial [Ictidomys tridecemlineatus]